MELFHLTTRAKMTILLIAGFPILTMLSIIVLSYCINRMDGKICTSLVSNIQSVWTIWIIATALILLMLFFGRRAEETEENKDKENS